MNPPFQTLRMKGRQAVTSTNDLYSKSLSLIELLVVIAVISVLVAMLMPAFRKVREIAATAQCMSNQRQIVTGLILYTGENNGRLPPLGAPYPGPTPGNWWHVLIRPYLGVGTNSTQIVSSTYMRCPAEKDLGVRFTYGVNYSKGGIVIMGYYTPGNPTYVGSAYLSKLSPSTILIADHTDKDGPLSSLNENYSPLVGEWSINTNAAGGVVGVDTDGDGFLDSNGLVWNGGTQAPYNLYAPRHENGIVCGFVDGSVKKVSLLDWVTNKENMWGP